MNRFTNLIAAMLTAAILLPMTCKADVTIWVKSANAPYVYAWKGETKPLGDFPGTQLSVQDDVTGWWLCYLPDQDEVNFILSYGTGDDGNQTGNIEGVTGTHYYQYPGGGDNGTYTDLGTNVNNVANPPTGVVINSENFPDPYFRQWLSTYTRVTPPGTNYNFCNLDGKGTDHLLTASEIASTTRLFLNGYDSNRVPKYQRYYFPYLLELTDLTGIRHFSSLEALFLCCPNLTGSIDLSNTSLEAFVTSNNPHKIQSLNFSGCTSLEYLDCSSDFDPDVTPALSSLDLTGCSSLLYLDFSINNLESIDLSDCVNLKIITAELNERLTSLDLSNNPKMKKLVMNGEHCQKIVLSDADDSDFRCLLISFDDLTELVNLDKQKKLSYLQVNLTQLTELDLTPNEVLKCVNLNYNYLLNSLTLPESVTNLTVYCSEALTKLDLSNLSQLKYLTCSSCGLYELDVANNPLLKTISCFENHLTGLDLSANTQLNNDDTHTIIHADLCFNGDDSKYYTMYPGGNVYSLWVDHNYGLNYANQTCELPAEVGEVSVEVNGQPTLKKFYYFRLDDNTSGNEKSLMERIREKNPDGNQTFDLQNLKAWVSGGTVVNGNYDPDNSQAPSRAASLDEISQGMVVGTILVLTPTTESDTEVSGTVTYTYDVKFNSPDAVDEESPITINWTADPSVVTSVLDLDIAPGGSQKVIYYNLDGRSSETPFDGVNIVVLRSTDGKTTTTKVVK